MHMKKVMMMRPKLVLKESMRVNQYMPPYEETAQQGEQSHGHTEGFLGLKRAATLTSVTNSRPIR